VIFYLVLLGIVSIYLISIFIWLNLDKSYLLYDSFGYYLKTYRVFEVLKGIIGREYMDIDLIRGPFALERNGTAIKFLLSPLLFISISQDFIVFALNLIFLTLLIIGVFKLAEYFFDKRVALLSICILLFYPIIFNHTRIFSIDLPLAAFVILSLNFLIRSKYFKKFGYTLSFIILTIIGTLTKFYFGLFIFGMILCYIYKNLRERRKKHKRKITDYFFIFFIFIIFIIFFLFLHVNNIWERILNESILRLNLEDIMAVQTEGFLSTCNAIVQRLFFISKVLIFNKMSFIYSILLFISLISFCFYKNSKVKEFKLIILFSIILPVIILFVFFLSYYDFWRYLLPIFPLLSIMSAWFLLEIKVKMIRNITIIFVIFIGLIQYLACSYNVNLLPEALNISGMDIVKLKSSITIANQRSSYPLPESHRQLPLMNTIEDIVKESKYKKIKILFADSFPTVYDPVCFEIIKQELPVEFDRVKEGYRGYRDLEDFIIHRLYSVDCIIMKEDSSVKDILLSPAAKNRLSKIRDYFLNINKKHKTYTLSKKIKMDSDYNILIFKRNFINVWIKSDDIKLICHKKIIDLYYKNKKLTDGLGLYGAVCMNDIWYDFREAVWEVNKRNEKEMIIDIRWFKLPIKEKWIFKVYDNILNYERKIEVLVPVFLSQLQTNIMLNREYNKWKVGQKTGLFEDGFNRDSYLEAYNSGHRGQYEEEIFLNTSTFPNLAVEATEHTSFRKSNIIALFNTTQRLKSRVVQYQSFPKKILRRGTSLNIKSTISVK